MFIMTKRKAVNIQSITKDERRKETITSNERWQDQQEQAFTVTEVHAIRIFVYKSSRELVGTCCYIKSCTFTLYFTFTTKYKCRRSGTYKTRLYM